MPLFIASMKTVNNIYSCTESPSSLEAAQIPCASGSGLDARRREVSHQSPLREIPLYMTVHMWPSKKSS